MTEYIYTQGDELAKEDVNTDQIDCWELNFKGIYEKWLKDPRYTSVHWLWRVAMEKPGELHTWLHKENGRYVYERNALFDHVTGVMHTNLAGCPYSYNHHIGEKCYVCGNDERHIKPFPRIRRRW